MAQMILTSRELSIGYRRGKRGPNVVQQGIELRLHRGALTCFLGPNGAGKSTLLRTLCGVQPPLSGEIELAGRPLRSYSEEERSRLIGLVLADKVMAGGLRVEEVVALGRHPYLGFFGRLERRDHERVEWALHETGISHKRGAYMAELSDGERQKVMIAKALAQECDLILLDEPTAFLDVVSRIEIMHLLHRLAEQGRSILLSTHDIEQALLLADNLWILSKESGFVQGATEDLVLEGAMDRFFSRGEVSFDHLRGSFRRSSEGLQEVAVEASADLACWAHNALLRHGYRGVAANTTAEGGAPALHLTLLSPGELTLRDHAAGTATHFCSFEELCSHLRQRDAHL